MKTKLLLLTSIILILFTAGFLWLAPSKNISLSPEQKKIFDALTFQSFIKANYSFASDADLDGLSDAKEIIYGSDPLKADSDGDGFLDGKEVSSGFDPLVAGKGTGLLAQREAPSLTVQYFNWLSQKTGNPDPGLEEEEVREFLSERSLLNFSLPPIFETDIKFTNDDPQKIAEYLTFTSNLTLPEEGSPYLALAGQLIKNQSFTTLSNLIKTVKKQLGQLKKAQVPALLKELHQRYVSIWQELEVVFEGLKYAQSDPVLIYLNQKRGEWLVEKIGEVEKLRATLIAQFKLLPFQQPLEQKQNDTKDTNLPEKTEDSR